MKILITGASGFLGSALAERFRGMGCHTSLLIRESSNLNRFNDLSNLRIGRYKSKLDISRFIHEVRPDVVIHAACCYGRGEESTTQILDANLLFGASILDSICTLNKKVSFINVGTVLARNINMYAMTKALFEELGVHIAENNSNIQFINTKLQHMYGPQDDPSKFIPYIIKACKNNQPSLLLTFGDQKRDFIHIADAVEAYVKIVESKFKLNKIEQIELGSGIAMRIQEIVKVIHRITSSKTELLFGKIPYRKNEAMLLVANIEILTALGWKPKFNFVDGIKNTIEMDTVT